MSKEGKKAINGKAFVAGLDGCKTAEDIFAFLGGVMDKATLTDRIGHVHDNDLINTLQAQKARCNIELGYRTSHEDCATLAAHRYQQLTGKSVKSFKAEVNRYMTRAQSQSMTQHRMPPYMQTRGGR